MAETCREAVQEVFADETGVLDTNQVVDRIYKRYPDRPWKPNAISAHLIGLSVNHTSSIHHPTLRKHGSLFSLGKGRYRRWDSEHDGKWEVIEGRVQLVDSDPLPNNGDDMEGIETSLSLERDLERSLLPNLGQLEPGLRLYKTETTVGQQFDTGEVGRLDILAIAQSGDFVVVELKAGKADDRVCGQILRYMGWVKENLAGSYSVRGIVVANDFSSSLQFAAKVMPSLALIRYEVRFDFTMVSAIK